jgi:hypothetical protein
MGTQKNGEAVTTDTTRPDSALKKKHVAICYHNTREARTMGMIRMPLMQEI